MVAASPQVASGITTRQRYRYDLLDSTTNYEQLLYGLFESPPKRFEGQDIAFLNLLCAQSIKGAENLDVKACIARLDRLTADVKRLIKRNLYKYPNNPEYGNCEPKWKMCVLVTVVKLNYGAAYNPKHIREQDAGVEAPMDNARDVFINGLLDEDRSRRHGTCASIPVLIVAIARRLGYPVGLAIAGRHIIARWDGEGLRFNIEASNPLGMTTQTDEEYRRELIAQGNRADAVRNPYFFRTLTAVEEFALFMTLRAECLIHAERYDEVLHISARALQYAPDDPIFISWARRGASSTIRHRAKQANAGVSVSDDALVRNAIKYLKRHELSRWFTILAHLQESRSELKLARASYEEACRLRPDGFHEQHDLQRFLRKQNLPRRNHMIPVLTLAQPRFQLRCKPHERASTLMQMADRYEAAGELVKARDALRDLYLMDPCESDVFARAREIENRPEFKRQWNAFVALLRQRQSST